MAGYDCLRMKKMKRKYIDRVNNDFSDFSLSSPATKIRRLDLDLPPIMEEDEIQCSRVNEEKAIVVYNPLQHYHPEHIFVDRDLVSGFKNRFVHDLCEDDDEKTKQQALEIVELDGEDEMMKEASMDVEEASLPQQQEQFMGGLHQWQQQQQVHCLISQLPQTNSTPISWYQ